MMTAALLFAMLLPAYPGPYVSGTLLDIRPSGDHYYGYSVQIENIVYSGWCEQRLITSHCDTDFLINAPVQVRLVGKSMFILRKNGKEQKVTIERRKVVGLAKPPSEN